ncbi:hypothetical protein LJC71_04940 [Desulfosarcina sp. OttesenSCG-928-A07]|nr:hypothetical protein [Desulfosarcina sp. OttesenSCG-928-G17]MDL2329084.1 hypothetical protein [Desulfosarcina sp. OttesenSCG-928-A07]
MNFKDALAFDAASVFLNMEEFAEEMVVDGVSMPALWGEENVPAPDIKASTVDAWGLNTETAVLLVLESNMTRPVSGQDMVVDGETWTVIKARPQCGILRLVLQRNVS